ncbi:hypothetical protein TNIN_262591 [Trichonephila inaurata madagascariensis]|uniref:Uncharacterized protein n=1 Tax=Trichonephila inaurata madagascariensis TaxID=2747483 RepID=A0A8X6MAN9_9ARAC|nr:hypothetical protein TNIN_262591 [Trichonephila inaurata madagascariensis]
MGYNCHNPTTIQRLSGGYNNRDILDFDARRRDRLSSSTWKNFQLSQIFVSSWVGHWTWYSLYTAEFFHNCNRVLLVLLEQFYLHRFFFQRRHGKQHTEKQYFSSRIRLSFI